MPSNPVSLIRHPHLRDLQHTLDRVTEEAGRLRRDLSDAQLVWQPAPEQWSIAGCFDHLYVTGTLYYPALREALQRAVPGSDGETFRPSLMGRFLIRAVSPDTERKVKTLRAFRPEHAPKDAPALDRFIAQQDELRTLLRAADGRALNRTKFASPATRLVRLTIGDALTMLVLHQQRHLGQALRVQQQPGFPVGNATGDAPASPSR